MMGMADLVTTFVINDGLEQLAAHPDQCLFLLGAFCGEPLNKLVNKDHINQAVELITSKKIIVAPYYELDMKYRPSVGIVASGVEDTQFLGDVGFIQQSLVLNPVTYATFDIKAVNLDTVNVSAGLNLDQLLVLGCVISIGSFTAKLKGINVVAGQDTVLFLDTTIPPGTPFLNWKASSVPSSKAYEVLSSMDKVTIQVNLLTTGQSSVHRLIALIIRYCLKRGRQYFDQFGLQVPTFSYTPVICTDDSELEFQSTFTIETKVMDSWVFKEIDPTQIVGITTTLHSTNPADEDVILS